MEKPVYPVDRVNNFSDAIFAIAITLLILDVKIPPSINLSVNPLSDLLENQTPQIIGLIVSFFVTALFWKGHLSAMKYVKIYDEKLLWYNILMLFFVVLMPFSTAFYSRYFSSNGAFTLYCSNLIAIGIFGYLSMSHIIKRESLSETLSSVLIKWIKIKAIIVPFVFFLCILIQFISPLMARFGFILIFIFQGIGEWNLKRKLST